tara:strand:- start:2567 stop:3169 length:603 start_codon:yes stop_codon:yes gene_type:complete
VLLKNIFWYFTKGLSSKECSYILKLGFKNSLKKGTIGGSKGNKEKYVPKKEIRNSDVCFLDDQKIYDLIVPYINSANIQAGWNFQYEWHESCQFTKYDKKQHYDWHQDSWKEPYGKNVNNYSNKIRKLSSVVLLSNPKDFEGGDLEIKEYSNNPTLFQTKQFLKKGSIIVVPSFILHRVTPVTKGIRYSLVTWTLGQPFK